MSLLKTTILPKLVLINTRIVLGTYTAVTLPFYTILQKPWRAIAASKKQWAKVEKSSDGSYFYWKSNRPPITLPNDYHLCPTFQSLFKKMVASEDLSKPRLAYRNVLSTKIRYDSNGQPVVQDGRVVKEIELAKEYTWLTNKQVFENIDQLTKGLYSLNIKSDDKVIIFADTRIEWLYSAVAFLNLGIPIITLFANLGHKGFVFGVNQQKSKCIVTSFDLLERIQKVINEIPTLEKIIYMQYDFQKKQPLPKFPDHIKLIPFDEVMKNGSNIKELSLPETKPDDLAMMMYTSGTTGIPKAVVFTNKQIKAAMICLATNVNDIAHEAGQHRYASFLPLAHSLGLTFELFMFSAGVTIGYSSPFTLTDTSPGVVSGQIGDLKLLKPTVIVSVPLILDRIVKEIYLKLNSRSPILPPLFNYLMDYKIRWTKRGYETPLLDKLVCKRVREQFGGNLKFIVCGGAAVSPKIEELIRAALGVKLLIGYGLTESTGGVIGKRRDDLEIGTVGVPFEGVNIRLIDWEEGGYKITDKPNPRGEILLSGDSIAQGYFGLDEETNSVFKVDNNGIRWFYSGDIGEMLPTGAMKIIDRKKDLAKLPNGEYISLGKIETIIKSSSNVENCCVCVHGTINDITALITPSIKQFKILAKKFNKENLTHEQLCDDNEIRQEILNDIRQVCLDSGLHTKEIPVKIVICKQEWTPDNDLLTSAFKLKRNNVLKYYKNEIDSMFNRA